MVNYATARYRADRAEDYTTEELEEAFEALVAKRDAAQAAISRIMAERSRRRDAELHELRAAVLVKLAGNA